MPEFSLVVVTWLCLREDRLLAVQPGGVDCYYLPGGLPEPAGVVQLADGPAGSGIYSAPPIPGASPRRSAHPRSACRQDLTVPSGIYFA